MKRFLILLLSTSISYFTYAQTPQIVCYQAVAANDQGAELIKSNIKVMMKILEGSSSGTPIFVEEHQVITDEFGLFSLDLGSKNPTDFAKIKWSANKYYLQANVDAGSGYKLIGTTQIVSVPYALNAGSADVAKTAADDADKDPKNELQALLVDPVAGTLKIVPLGTPGASDQVAFSDKDSDPTNELQTLKFDANKGELSITDKAGNNNGNVNFYDRFLGAPGASPSFPQGVVGKYKFVKSSEIYTVPIGSTFYVTANATFNGQMKIEYKGTPYEIYTFPSSPVFPSGTVISKSVFTGFEVLNDKRIEPVIIDLKNAYQIPPNKVLIIQSGMEIGPNTLLVDNELTSFYAVNNGTQFVSIPGGPNGLTIKYSFLINTPVYTGYLIDMP